MTTTRAYKGKLKIKREYQRAFRKSAYGKLYRKMWSRLRRGSKLPIEFPPYKIGPSSKPRGTRWMTEVYTLRKKVPRPIKPRKGYCNLCESVIAKTSKRCDYCIKRYGRD